MPFDGLIPYSNWETRLEKEVAEWKEYLESPISERQRMATIDFETRSPVDLKKHGSWIYAKNPATEAMCLCYKLPKRHEHDPSVQTWHKAHPQHLISESSPPLDLFAFILAGGLIEAHNSFFERVIWFHIMVKRHGWPEVGHTQWRCSAAKCSACSLPRDLDGAGKAMGLSVVKDAEGRRIMLKLAKPRKPRKAEVSAWKEKHGDAPMPILWHEDEEDIYKLWEYCAQDVRSEEALSEAVPDLTLKELALWQFDQLMNWRGVRFDLELANKALEISSKWKDILNKELFEMTGITAATKRVSVKEWLKANEGLVLQDTTAATVDWVLSNGRITGRARRVLEILKQVNRTSIRKFQAMLDKVDPEDGRARDLLMWHGANTGRWSGKGIQVQNFPRGKAKNAWGKKGAYFDMDRAVEDIMTGDAEWASAMSGDVIELVSSALRGSIISEPGRDLIVADYAAIEARVVLWLADATSALEVFLRGEDIYCDMATGIYGFEVRKADHPNERQFGKQAILGLGYGMGFVTFLLTCRKYDIHFSVSQVKGILKGDFDRYCNWVRSYLTPKRKDEEDPKAFRERRTQAGRTRRKLEEARENPDKIVHELALMKFTVDVYRKRYEEVKALWKSLEEAAISAVRAYDGTVFKAGKCDWFVENDFLVCRLPSGRPIRYRNPELKPTKTSWGQVKEGLRYMTVVTGGKWARTHTYGGKLAENITQATARDAMSDAMLRCSETGSPYDIGFTVHDELVAEVDEDKGSTEDFEEVLSKCEPWLVGCPIAAEGHRFKRYRKA